MTIKQLASFSALLAIYFFQTPSSFSQCPTLSQNCTLDPCGNQQPCNLCPGDVITVHGAGTNLKAGDCVKWYMGTTPNFNPYTGGGNLLGCSKVDLPPPDECSSCPQIIGMFVDACGTEQANEFMVITSGSGFYVANANLDFDGANNANLPNDDDIGLGGCNWQNPSSSAVAAIQAACPSATVVGAGPGTIVPPGVAVVILTSAGFNNPYSWGGICPLISTIYVMQNGCNRLTGAFTNGGGPPTDVTTIFSLDCGCSDASTYNTGSLQGGNGAFFSDFLFPIYGNAGCGIPGLPFSLPPAPPIVLQVPPFDTTLWKGLCNGGPYYIVGIVSPLPAGCPQVFTNYMKFNVICPTPKLLQGNVCNSVNNFSLDDLVDPTIPNGVWSGAHVENGNTFNALNLAPGSYTVAFDPDGDCALNATTTIIVNSAPKAVLSGGPQTVCAGQPMNLTVTVTGGTAPFYITPAFNGSAQTTLVANNSPFVFTVNPTMTGVYSLADINDPNCMGTVQGTALATVLPAPTGVLKGKKTICVGQSTNLIFDFGGSGPWTFSYSANGVIIDTLTTSKDPDTLVVSPIDTTFYKIVKLWNATCPGIVSGVDTIYVPAQTMATLSGSTAICGGAQPVNLTVDFSGGAGPYTFIYTENGVSQPPITTSTDPYTLVVTPSSSTTYTLSSLINGICSGITSGSAAVSIATPPQAVLAGNASICAGASTPISIDFTNGAAPWTFVYSENGLTQPPITTSTDPYILNVSPLANTDFDLLSVSSGSCSGTANGMATVNIVPSLPTSISGGTTIQAGQSDVLQLSVPTAPAGATIVYNLTANGQPMPSITTTQNPYDLTVTPSVTTVYIVNSCTVNGCPATPQGNAVVTVQSQSLTAFIAGNDTICAGGSAKLTVSFQGGVGPYTFVYGINGIPQPSITTLSNPYLLTVQPNSSATYNLFSATIGGQPANTNGLAFVTVIAPVLTLSPANVGICEGSNGLLTVSLNSSSTPPFSFEYTVNAGPPTTIVSPTGTFQIPISPSFTTTYAIQNGSADGCPTAFNNSQSTVTVSGPPTGNNLQISCDTILGTYIVEFDVNSQPAPAGATLVNGTLVPTGHFMSAPISVTNPYSFNLSNGCGQSLIAGQNTCSCTTNAGTMTFKDTLEVCVGSTVVTAHEGDQNLDANDKLVYVLHTTPSLPIGSVLAINPFTPTFSFLPASMVAGKVYYISAVAGNNDGAGSVDLNDPCLSVAEGTPVVFFAPPTMMIEVTDTTVCVGTTVQLTIKLTGNDPFKFTYSQNGAPRPPVNTPNDNYTIGAVLQQTTTFLITSYFDATCPGVLPPPVTIHVNQVPTLVGQIDENCDLASGTYSISGTLTGGNGQYLFSGGGGSFTGGFFQSAPIPIGTAYNYLLGDTEQCGFINVMGNPMCSCATDAGQYPFNMPLRFCAGDAAVLPPISGSNLEMGDTLIYVLHKTAGPNPLLWTILQTNDDPSFTFILGLMSPDSTYYISAVAANKTPVGINLSDPCLSVSPGVAVIWNQPVSAILGTNTEICQGDTAHLRIIFSGNDEPYSFSYFENGVAKPTLISPTDTFYLNVTPSLSANYSLKTVSGAICAGSINGGGGAAVSVKFPPQIVELQQSCDFNANTYSISFKIANGADTAKTYFVSGTPGVLTSDTIFTSGPIAFGSPYNMVVTTPIGCEVTVAGMGQCVCTSSAGTMTASPTPLDFCETDPAFVPHNGDEVLDNDDASLHFILFSNKNSPKTSILATSGSPAIFNFDGATMTAETIYFVSAIVGNNNGSGQVTLNDPCLDISQPVEIIFHAPPTAFLSGTTAVCPGEEATVEIAFTGAAPWLFEYALDGVASPQLSTSETPFLITANPQGQLNFNLLTVSDLYCNGTVSGTAVVDVKPIPMAQLSGPANVCPGFPAILTVELAGGTLFDMQIKNSLSWDTTILGVTNGQHIIVYPTGPAPITYSITALSTAGTDCTPDFGTPISIQTQELYESLSLSKYGSYNLTCPGASDGTIAAVVIGGLPPYSFSWNNGATTQSLANQPAGDYEVTIVDASGCIDTTGATLIEPPRLEPTLTAVGSTCFGQQEGTLAVEAIFGGQGPYQISLSNGQSSISSIFPLVFSNLSAGNYQLTIQDASGCSSETTAVVPAPQELLVELGPDVLLPLGDSVLLVGQTNLPIDTAWFSPKKYLTTSDSTVSWSKPTASIRYELTVKDASGCTASDFVLIEVDATRHIYVPTAFSPEGNSPNDILTVFAGHEVEKIKSFQIFDRWGESVFEAQNFQPNDLANGWDGWTRGKLAAAAVYVWWIEAEFVDGTTGVYKGDVTLIR